MADPAIAKAQPWQQPLADLLLALDAAVTGLSAEQAALHLARYGPNELRPTRQRALVLQFLARFGNPLVLILLTAGIISALTGELRGAMVISAVVTLSVTLDFVQEYRARQAAERLRAQVAVRAAVVRDGRVADLLPQAIVPGDVIELSAGDLVPADARLLEGRDLFVNQALLTGEPYPVERRPQATTAAAYPADADNMVCMGSSVVSGWARALVVRTGAGTALGDIASSLQHEPPPTAFEQGMRQFGGMILRLTLLLVLFVLMVNLLLERPPLESFLFAVALAVGLTPELLPMIHSVTLGRGAMRLSRAKVIVKRLTAIEDLGGMDVFCTDKTGTLTEATIRLERHVDAGGGESERVLWLAYLNSAFESGLKSPLDDAILAHEHLDVSAWHKVDEVPFDFERRRVSVLIDDGARRWLVVKGAPEEVLRVCATVESGAGQTAPIDATVLARLQDLHEDLGRDGFRTLGIAWRQVPQDHADAVLDDERDLTFAGYAGFLDPPKPDAAKALADLQADGVAIKIISGDNQWVTRHVCAQIGLAEPVLMLGSEIDALDEAALRARVTATTVFCRVTPAQKERIIRTLRQAGHVVGYLGDGINDAPSLQAADVGISVEGAVDVAKEAADMVLLEKDLGVLHRGVREGRRTFGNVMKYVQMGTSSNFGNMFSMAGAVLFLPFLPMLPIQILLNNLIYDVSELGLPLDRVDDADLAVPKRWDVGHVQRFMLTLGPVSSLFDFLTFWLLLHVLRADEALFHTGWFIESMATQILVIFLIRTRGAPWRSRPSPWLLLSSLGCLALAIGLTLSPWGPALGFVAPPGRFFLLLALMLVAYLVMVEGVKRWFYRHLDRPHSPTPGRQA